MLIREIAFHLAEPGRSAMAHLEIDGREYLITGGKSSVTVYVGRWIGSTNAQGRTFWEPAEIVKHYKRHGEELLRYANRLTHWVPVSA